MTIGNTIYLLCALVLLQACNASVTIQKNQSTLYSEDRMHKNPGSYFEIPVSDIDRAIKFYSSVFGYDFTRETIHGNEMAMFPLNSDAEGIGGALAKGEIYVPSKTGSLIYLNVQSIDKTLEAIEKHGNAILFPKTKAGDYGFVAEFEDSEGNRVALFQNLD